MEVLIAITIFSLFVLFISRHQITCIRLKDISLKRVKALQKIISFLQDQNEVVKQGQQFIEIQKVDLRNEFEKVSFNLKRIFGESVRLNSSEFKFAKVSVVFDLLNKKRGCVEIFAVV